MSLKKNIGVLVLLLVLLSMSAVSAEDVSVDTNNTYQAPNEGTVNNFGDECLGSFSAPSIWF